MCVLRGIRGYDLGHYSVDVQHRIRMGTGSSERGSIRGG